MGGGGEVDGEVGGESDVSVGGGGDGGGGVGGGGEGGGEGGGGLDEPLAMESIITSWTSIAPSIDLQCSRLDVQLRVYSQERDGHSLRGEAAQVRMTAREIKVWERRLGWQRRLGRVCRHMAAEA